MFDFPDDGWFGCQLTCEPKTLQLVTPSYKYSSRAVQVLETNVK